MIVDHHICRHWLLARERERERLKEREEICVLAWLRKRERERGKVKNRKRETLNPLFYFTHRYSKFYF